MTRATPTTMTAMTAMAGNGRRRDRQERQRAQRPAVTADLLAVLAGRLTGRDRWMFGMLAEHRVLTTTQLTALAFGGRREAERRLAALWAWRCVDRFRPQTPLGGGSAPFHWVLDDAGAAVLAAGHGLTDTEFGYRRATALAIAHSQRLGHTVGTNTLLTALATANPATSAGAALLYTGPGADGQLDAGQLAAGQLADWWGERRCAAAWGDLVRPDAAATWQTVRPAVDRITDGRAAGGRAAGGAATVGALGFAVEFDTGTETLARVAAKLGDYADLAGAAGRVLPVLFWLPSVARESALHRHLDPTGLLVATAAADHAATAGGPTGPVWRPAPASERGRDRGRDGRGDGGRGVRRERMTLDQLTAAWAATDTLSVGTLEAGLGWPSPDPAPPGRRSGLAVADRADGDSHGARERDGRPWGS
jgi:hypothetical protein